MAWWSPRRIAELRRLPRDERRLTVKATLLCAALRPTLHVVPLRVVHRALDVAPGRAGPVDPATVARAVERAARVTGAACLPQALTARFLLERGGVATSLHIGVRRNASGTFEAHAWVDAADRIVVGGFAGEWRRLHTFGPRVDGSRAKTDPDTIN